jgi:Mg-chelatase subunit ChlD
MVSWSVRRKSAYTGVVLGILFILAGTVFGIWYYEPPTCFDRKHNGDETGVDCGGSCALLCSSEALDPIILWQRVFKVSTGVYNVVSYIENPNVTSESQKASYVFSLFDAKGSLLLKREGLTLIPANQRFAIFEGNIVLPTGIPTKAVFEFTQPLVWQKIKSEPAKILVEEGRLSKADSTPRVDAFLSNQSLIDARNVRAVVIVSDEKGNALGASQTFVERIPKSSEVPIVFTWPEPFEAEVGLCKRPVDVVLAIDRSGSMDDDGLNPPQPLTDVKDAALVFVDELSVDDRAGLVSFGTTATNPPDRAISADMNTLREVIRSIKIILNGGQNTNIGDGILKSREELLKNARDDAGKFIVLLTDGIPTHPQKSDDDLYPEKYAGFEANAAKRDGIEIFTIGLGNKVKKDFLKTLSSGEGYSFNVLTSSDLRNVYKEIANEICKKGPVVIEILPVVNSR